MAFYRLPVPSELSKHLRTESDVTFGVKYGLIVVTEKPLHAVTINYIEKEQWVNVVSGQLISEVMIAYVSL